MSEIYAQASCVLIWLGPSSEDSSLAFKTIERLGGVEDAMEWEELYSNVGDGETMGLRPRRPEDLALLP
jgi:hypothetical protein